MGLFGLGKSPQKLYEKGMDAYSNEDYGKALPLLEQAAGLNHVEAAYICGIMYEEKKGTGSGDMALKWYEKAAEQNHAKAQIACAKMYELGRGVHKDEVKALRWYEKAAEQNYLEAQLKCAEMYEWGRGTAVNVDKAIKWYREVLRRYKEDNWNHSNEECTRIERDIQFLEGKRTEIVDEGKELFRKAQAAERDSEALQLYEAAAERKHSKAAYFCGCMYREGKGTVANPAKALHWLEASREKEAAFICAEMYKKGEGTKPDLRKAINCLLWIADMDDLEAQMECGKLFYSLGDRDQAYFWLAKAALQNQDLNIQEEATDFIGTYMDERMGDLMAEL